MADLSELPIKVLGRDEVEADHHLWTRERIEARLEDCSINPAERLGWREILRMMDEYQEPSLSIDICPSCRSSERSQRTCGHPWHNGNSDPKSAWKPGMIIDIPGDLQTPKLLLKFLEFKERDWFEYIPSPSEPGGRRTGQVSLVQSDVIQDMNGEGFPISRCRHVQPTPQGGKGVMPSESTTKTGIDGSQVAVTGASPSGVNETESPFAGPHWDWQRLVVACGVSEAIDEKDVRNAQCLCDLRDEFDRQAGRKG